MKKFEVEGHEPSFLPEGEWELVWSDEFDGTELDRTKWDFRLNFWGKPFEGYTDQGIVLDGKSHIELHRTERNGCYVSPQLQTGSNSFDYLTTEKLHELILSRFHINYSYKQVRVIAHQLGFSYVKHYPEYDKTPSDAELQLKKN